jgi:hypothetical protein
MATSAAAADATLIAACKRGDREAFRLLFEKYKDRVYSLALHFSGNESVAQDVAQKIFLKLYTSMRTSPPGCIAWCSTPAPTSSAKRGGWCRWKAAR